MVIVCDCLIGNLWNEPSTEIWFEISPVIFILESRFWQTRKDVTSNNDQFIFVMFSTCHFM